jgi:ABC-2 type transport system permease protein
MDRILKIAKREFNESVRSKTFIISVLIAPLVIGAAIFLVGKFSHQGKETLPSLRVAFTDLSGKLSEKIITSFAELNKSGSNRPINVLPAKADANNFNVISEEQKNKLRSGSLDVYVVIDPNIAAGEGIDPKIAPGAGTVRLYTYKTKASNLDTLWVIEGTFGQAIRDYRYKLWNIDIELFKKLSPVSTKQIEISSAGDKERAADDSQRAVSMMVPFFFMYLVFLGIFANGQQLITSIIEEKSSRVIEVLLSAVTPFELMAGKIIGLCAVSITVIGIWATMAYSATQFAGIRVDVTAMQVLFCVIYYILGFVLLGSVMAGIGSVCNTLKDAQNMMMPITIIVIIPMMSFQVIIQNPDGMYARALSFFPPVTSMVMVLRLSAGSTAGFPEILATIVVLIVSMIIAIWLAAKVFRTGILMYGKKPTLREIALWLRQR